MRSSLETIFHKAVLKNDAFVIMKTDTTYL